MKKSTILKEYTGKRYYASITREDDNYYYSFYEVFEVVNKAGKVNTDKEEFITLVSEYYDEKFMEAIIKYCSPCDSFMYAYNVFSYTDSSINSYYYDRNNYVDSCILEHENKEYSYDSLVKLFIKIDVNNRKRLNDVEIENIYQAFIKEYPEDKHNKNNVKDSAYSTFRYFRPLFIDFTFNDLTVFKKLGNDNIVDVSVIKNIIKIVSILGNESKYYNNDTRALKDYKTEHLYDISIAVQKALIMPLYSTKFNNFINELDVRTIKRLYKQLPINISVDNNINIAKLFLNDVENDYIINDDLSFVFETDFYSKIHYHNDYEKQEVLRLLKKIRNKMSFYAVNDYTYITFVAYNYLLNVDHITVDVCNTVQNAVKNAVCKDNGSSYNSANVVFGLLLKIIDPTTIIDILDTVDNTNNPMSIVKWVKFINNYDEYKELPVAWWKELV